MPAPSLHASVAESLGSAIVSGEIEPGTILRLEELCGQFGVSRTVVRDAIKALEAQHLVHPQRRIGIAVLEPAQWDVLAPTVIRWRLQGPQRMQALHEISELRLGLEPVAAALAATRATPEQLGRLVDAARGMRHTAAIPDLESYLAHDIDYHRTLLQASGNPMLATLGYVVEEVLTGRTHQNLMPPTPNPEAVDLHTEVVEAIQAHDAARAERAMRDIVSESRAGAEEMNRSA